jgi:hypothetical protein
MTPFPGFPSSRFAIDGKQYQFTSVSTEAGTTYHGFCEVETGKRYKVEQGKLWERMSKAAVEWITPEK